MSAGRGKGEGEGFIRSTAVKVGGTAAATILTAWLMYWVGPPKKDEPPHPAVDPYVEEEPFHVEHEAAAPEAPAASPVAMTSAAVTPVPAAVPATGVPDGDAARVADFGGTLSAGGLSVTVGPPNYQPGCTGTLGFEIALRNVTAAPVAISIGSANLSVQDSTRNRPARLFMQRGAATLSCYRNTIPPLEGIAPGETARIAIRMVEPIRSGAELEFRFSGTGQPLDDLRWRLKQPG
jgi:hypothetical protein